jgi:membrane-bound lytic murein transglycosylase D
LNESTYVVKSGDNLGAIASRYRVTVEDLKEWNNLKKHNLKIGQQLIVYVPGKSAKDKNAQAEKPKAETQTLAATPAETKTAKADSTSVAMVSKMSEAAATEEYILYTVQSGDSLFTIAKKFPGITDADLKAFNNIRNVKGLYPGQQIKIPKRA